MRYIIKWMTFHKVAAALSFALLLICGVWGFQTIMAEEPIEEASYVANSVTSQDGTTFGYRQYGGGGPGLILLHGGMGSSEGFAQLASLLADDFAVYVPDRRGRGMSGPYTKDHRLQKEVEDMEELVARTDAHYVFGLSSGAIVALESARQLETITKIAVYEPPIPLKGEESTVGWVPQYRNELARNNLGAAMVTAAIGTGSAPFIFTVLPRFVSEPIMNFAIWAEGRTSKPGDFPLRDRIPTLLYEAPVVAGMENKIEPFRQIKAKVLLMNGSNSPRNLQAPTAALHNVLPSAQIVVFEGADHLAPSNGERPRVIAAKLRQFFSASQ